MSWYSNISGYYNVTSLSAVAIQPCRNLCFQPEASIYNGWSEYVRIRLCLLAGQVFKHNKQKYSETTLLQYRFQIWNFISGGYFSAPSSTHTIIACFLPHCIWSHTSNMKSLPMARPFQNLWATQYTMYPIDSFNTLRWGWVNSIARYILLNTKSSQLESGRCHWF